MGTLVLSGVDVFRAGDVVVYLAEGRRLLGVVGEANENGSLSVAFADGMMSCGFFGSSLRHRSPLATASVPETHSTERVIRAPERARRTRAALRAAGIRCDRHGEAAS